MNELGATVCFPLLLSAFGVDDDMDRLNDLLSVLVSVFVRHNVICGLENSRLENKVFEEARRIHERHSVVETIAQMRDFAPSDTAFAENFRTAEIKRVATARYLLRSLETELRGTGEVAVETPSRVHVEHIYPQNPRDGERWDEHGAYVNRLGNLTLLGRRLNQQLSNALFAQKSPVYAESDLRLTKQLAGRTEWTPATIDERQAQLSELAAEIWTL